MLGNLFALSLIMVIAVSTIGVCKNYRSPTLKNVLFGIFCIIPAALGFLMLQPLHACDAGGTIAPALFGSISIGSVVIWQKRSFLKLFLIATITVACAGLATWSIDLVHHDTYSGSPGRGRINEMHNNSILYQVRASIVQQSSVTPDLVLLQGWAGEICHTPDGIPLLARNQFILTKTSTEKLWHSFFSGIFRYQSQEVGIWCFGGELNQCAKNLQLRDR